MQPLRISFGHSVRIGDRTVTHMDLLKIEWKDYQAALSDQGILITPKEGNPTLVPFGNVAYCELKVNGDRLKIGETPDGTGQERKGKARAT